MAKLLFLAGSTRVESINKKLAQAAANMARDAGAEVTFVDLKNYPMPIYDGDLEERDGVPEAVQKLKALFVAHDGFFIASPEFNSSMTPLLKNTLDWISRPHEENEGTLIAYRGKVAALGATSPGALGGLRGLVPLRMMLGNIGVHVVPMQVAVSKGLQAFDEDDVLIDAGPAKMLKATVGELIETARKMN